MTPEQILALIASLSGEPDPAAFEQLRNGGADPDYPVAIIDCPRPVVPDEIEGETVICGTVTVPYDHRDPEGRTITIAFNLYKAESLSPAPDPVIYLHGGPGDGAVRSLGRTIELFQHLRGRRDIIAIDERGVDNSAPEMDCYDTFSAQLQTVLDMQSGATPPQWEDAFVEGCLAELDERGIDISLINTEQNAMDVPAVMSALGYDTYNIYGASYGTKLTQEVLRQNPPGIRSAVIDGNAPPWLPLYSMFWQAHSDAIRYSFGPCEADPVCAEAYPDIVDRTFQLFETLYDEPIQTSTGEEVTFFDAYAVIDQRGTYGGEFYGLTPWLPLMVSQLENGETEIIEQIIAGQLPPETDTPEAIRSSAAAAGLSAAEMAQVDAMLAAAEHINLAEDTVETAARALESARDGDSRGADLAEIFDDRLGAAVAALDTQEARIEAGQAYLNLRFEEPSTDLLVTLVETHLPTDAATELAAMARQLSPEGVDRVFELVEADNRAAYDTLEYQFQTFVYACQEDFSDGFNSRERMAELMEEDGSWGPNMRSVFVDYYGETFIDHCALFEKHPRENWTVPVSTDLPVLSMNGELDINTAASWGIMAVEDFSNAQVVIVPESAHGTMRYSQCARDIAVAFLDNPEEEVDTACIPGERAPVMLPDGTMHQLTQ
ncbi:alpha/beta fold hydrolase [Pelagovum pacificum]|uniref:Alpha/beta hydrolase n=1 Tax=Pelagovum pacificum TaxID=2588711 RepID=A0A5C5GAS7_9RHOB|nr:alpha/beta hydrolase [Pelagovum pacificum]QQA41288.1 alpha/beta hydrolase [Pelagovum pacificum]TNY31905.1 alpha/beta hydrolase [Pelagovum pacificum]